MNRNELLKLNMLSNFVFPNYELNYNEIKIKLRFNNDGKVAVLGYIDNNYLVWFSITSISDYETNEYIFNILMSKTLRKVSSSYNVNKIRLTDDWYETSLLFDNQLFYGTDLYDGKLRFKLNDYWNISDGAIFSNELVKYYQILLKRANFRAESYTIILKRWHELLQTKENDDAVKKYFELKDTLIPLVEKESYLLMTTDDEVRKLYLQLRNDVKHLYNSYMSEVR